MGTWSESESEESICSDKSLDDEEKAITFVTSVEKVSPYDHELILYDTEELTYDELSFKSNSFFDEACNVTGNNIELNKKLAAL
ncbi:hypothetical protein D8674_028784 [Pyrus ussuriensis x Pyrus communis]|uniref:Uncharacterized protein n=1 Tax=Pyrus ussuriensis x Pyrus communis TaxID=2448454 RepID=A0A5N5I0A3_9ROSA|nr:hypothetical protein D8674_028784 [Pyrus ussuriensis x Pyrus communis]